MLYFNPFKGATICIESSDAVANKQFKVTVELHSEDKEELWMIDAIEDTDTFVLTYEEVLAQEFKHCGALAECVNCIVEHYRKRNSKAD